MLQKLLALLSAVLFAASPGPVAAPEPALTGSAEAMAVLQEMTLEEKIWQLFVVTPEQLMGTRAAVTTVTEAAAAEALRQRPVGGVIFFSQNLRDRAQSEALLGALQAGKGPGLLLAVDEEGGTVSRVGRNPAMGATRFGPMAQVGASGDPEQARAVGRTIGAELRELGFTLDFAPVADVCSNPRNTVIGSRAFSSDPAQAAEFVTAAVEGFHESGMACTLKHFPGHGDTEEDSHTALAVSRKTREELCAGELLPFAAGIAAGADCVMVGHIALPNVQQKAMPASLSEEIVTGLLREELGFTGVAVTDALNMGGVTGLYSAAQAAVLAVQAGEDQLLMPADLEAAWRGVWDAVQAGRISERRIDESVLRILELKQRYGLLPGGPEQ